MFSKVSRRLIEKKMRFVQNKVFMALNHRSFYSCSIFIRIIIIIMYIYRYCYVDYIIMCIWEVFNTILFGFGYLSQLIRFLLSLSLSLSIFLYLITSLHESTIFFFRFPYAYILPSTNKNRLWLKYSSRRHRHCWEIDFFIFFSFLLLLFFSKLIQGKLDAYTFQWIEYSL